MLDEAQLRILILKNRDFQEATLYRLKTGWNLQFMSDASLASLNVRIFVNHPHKLNERVNRDKYREVEWVESHLKTDSYAKVPIVIPGSFNYFFTTNGSDKKKDASGGGYFLVDPVLTVGLMDGKMSLNSICCQTVMPKLLGTFKEWPDKLRVSKESGYNMIHFTPVQELGQSDSPYCLKDQKKLDPRYSTMSDICSLDDVLKFVKEMKELWGVLSITDLVYNHTANESPWIQENPDCSYNMINSPHLKPAYLMDRVLWHFSMEVGRGEWENRGLPPCIDNETQMRTMHEILSNEVMPKHRFWEFDQCNIQEVLAQFRSSIISGERGDNKPSSDIFLMHDPKFRRLKCRIDIPQAIKNYYCSQPDNIPRDKLIYWAYDDLRGKLEDLNSQGKAQMMDHIKCAINNFIANAKWRFIDEEGPRLGKVGPDSPLTLNYFTHPKATMTVEEEENMMNGEQGAYCMAHNGWVMSDDPLENFAEPGSNVYLRRELNPWCDSVKLRYGHKKEDSPYLWKYMREYTVESATIFHGFKLHDCHRTPLHVAEYMLDEARMTKPDLYVIAELFTNSEYVENTYINRLGINSLIRGTSCSDLHELSQLVKRYAGDPVGSFYQPSIRQIMPSPAHTLIMQQMNDPHVEHMTENLLPYCAAITMTSSPVGCNRGYDEMVPHSIDVIKEKRLYKSWTVDASEPRELFARADTGIIRAKKALNDIHNLLEEAGYQEAQVDMVTDDVLSVTRHNPTTHQSVVLFANTSFYPSNRSPFTNHVHLPGLIEDILFNGTLKKSSDKEYKMDPAYINGLENYSLTVREHVETGDNQMVKIINSEDEQWSMIQFNDFVQGSVVIVKVVLPKCNTYPCLVEMRNTFAMYGPLPGLDAEGFNVKQIEDILLDMTLDDIHRVLFNTDNEEKDDGLESGAYNIPGFGPLKYCGLQGFVTLLDRIRPLNDLGHPLCQNLRKDNLMIDYIYHRLYRFPGTRDLSIYLRKTLFALIRLHRYLIPSYFDILISGLYTIVMVIHCRISFKDKSSKFMQDLSLGSVQMCSYVRTAKLPKLSKNISKPFPPKAVENKVEACLTLSAGFPHFASGFFRNWGRDTFISMRGLLLITRRYQEARFLILGYAGCLRHGLIPNLLGEGINGRYNCRDAVWFWLQSIKDFCQMAPKGITILQDNVRRLFPQDDSDGTIDEDQPLQDVMQEALQKHATGLKFRERNAGMQIDSEMNDEGFNTSIGVDWETGFVFGGNNFNCGTWMNTMGSSHKAGNKGVPATPRDGSAVEIVGLCASIVSWLSDLNKKGTYPHKGVEGEGSKFHTWDNWFELLKKNFELHFWIDPQNNDPKFHQGDLINKKGVYKDSVGSSRKYTDYQLRCNFPIAIVACPDLFTPERAWESLSMFEKHLLGPLGAKTLDPSDLNYIGDYFNSDDSHEFKKAKGFNFHQGPEWVWPVGYFFRAKMLIAKKLAKPNVLEETLTFVEKRLRSHYDYLQTSDWKSLPQLTNSNGSVCEGSCSAYASSVGCLLETCLDITDMKSHLQERSFL